MNDDTMNATTDRIDELAPTPFDELASGCCQDEPKSVSPAQATESCGPRCGCHGPAESGAADFETRARKAVNKLRPFLQMDGGDMEIVAIEDNNVLVRLVGACQSCPSSTMHMKYGIETALKKEIPEFGELICID
jgi:Fe-S cluster biogenesis protein NfuA